MREEQPLLKLCELYDDYSIVYDHMRQLEHLAAKFLSDTQTFRMMEIRVASYSRDENGGDETDDVRRDFEMASLFFPKHEKAKESHVFATGRLYKKRVNTSRQSDVQVFVGRASSVTFWSMLLPLGIFKLMQLQLLALSILKHPTVDHFENLHYTHKR